jgi:hypothetical protein
MNRGEAKNILSAEMEMLRQLSYPELLERLLDRNEIRSVAAPSGTTYRVELHAEWDDDRDRTVRVIATIKKSGWSRLLPLARVAVCAPDGSFVGDWGA